LLPIMPFYIIGLILLFPIHSILQLVFRFSGTQADTISFIMVPILMIPLFYIFAALLELLLSWIALKLKFKKAVTEISPKTSGVFHQLQQIKSRHFWIILRLWKLFHSFVFYFLLLQF